MKSIKTFITTFLITSVLPSFAFAQTGGYCDGWDSKPKKIADIFKFGTCLINNSIVPLIFTLALVYFIYGIVKYILNPNAGDKEREEGKKFMIWGIVALFVMVSVWGLVKILTTTFGTGGVSVPLLPTK